MQKKCILITGGAGYIGSHVARLFSQKDYHVIILDHAPAPHHMLTWATYVRDDFASAAALHRICSSYTIEAVIHCAAYIDVQASIKNPRHYYQNNLIKTCMLLDTMLECGIHTCIFSSSSSVYGNPVYTPIDECHPRQPISPYGTTKHMVEQLFNDYHQAYGLSYACLRYFNVAGAQPNEQLSELNNPETDLIPLLLHALHENKPFIIYGSNYDTPDGTYMRDFVHVQDVALAHYQAFLHLKQTGESEIFNIAAGRSLSVQEIAERAQKLFNKKLQIIYKENLPGDPDRLIANTTKANLLLSWYPRYSDIEFILGSAYESFLQQKFRKQLLA